MNTNVPPGYKQTEVGVIPEEWETKAIGELCEYQNGTSLERLFCGDDGLKVISIGNYSVNGDYVDNGVRVSVKHRKMVEKYVLRRDDLTMSLNDKTSVGAIIGRVLLIDSDDTFVFNQRTMRLRARYGVSASYLHHAINADRAHCALVGLAKPGTQIYINTDDVIGLKLPTPPLPEQRAIAAALSDVDALLAKLDQLIAKKRDLKQATMQQLLTGQTRLPGFRGEWKVKRLGDVAAIKTGKKNNEDKVEEGQYPFFVRSQTVECINSYSFDGEAILVPGEGGIGSIFHYIVGKFDYHQRVYKISDFSPDFCGKYVFFCMTQMFNKQAMRNSVKATVDSLRLPTFQEFEFLAPSYEEQTAIAAILSDMDAEIAALEARRDKTRALKQGMMQELLTGRIRLV